jgi:hypothetical protein
MIVSPGCSAENANGARFGSPYGAVTLDGVPRIGKSRLMHEVFQLVEAEPDFTTWRQSRSLPYGEGPRLRLGRQYVEEGRRADGDAEPQRSLAFWREVGATRYVREGEALLATSA